MTIKQHGGIFGRNPTFNNVTVDGVLTVDQIVEQTGAAGITLDGVTLKDGNVVLADGKGIDFSATAGTGTSELFDDYEEGTWTPVVADAATGGNQATALITNGYYTKIGNIVHATCQLINVNTTGLTAGSRVFVVGLPFTARSVTSTANFVCASLTHSISFSQQVLASVSDNTNYVELMQNSSGAAPSFLVISNLTSGSARILFTLTYEGA